MTIAKAKPAMIPVEIPAPAPVQTSVTTTALPPEVIAAGNRARLAFGEPPIEVPEAPAPTPETPETPASPVEVPEVPSIPEVSEVPEALAPTESEMPAWATRIVQSQEALFGMLRGMGQQAPPTPAPTFAPEPAPAQIPADIAAIADQLDMSTSANRAFITSLLDQRTMRSTFAELAAERAQSKAQAARASILADVEKERAAGFKYADPKAVLHAHLFEGLSVRDATKQSHDENVKRFGLPTKPVSPVRLVQPPGANAVMAPGGTPAQTRPPPPPDFDNMTDAQITAGARKIAARYGR